MLSLQRECKFSKIDVFIISVIFISKSIQKEIKKFSILGRDRLENPFEKRLEIWFVFLDDF